MNIDSIDTRTGGVLEGMFSVDGQTKETDVQTVSGRWNRMIHGRRLIRKIVVYITTTICSRRVLDIGTKYRLVPNRYVPNRIEYGYRWY